MAVITGRAMEKSGVVLGGLGTGSVEIRPDGEFHEWQIANNGEWKEDCRDKEVVEDNSVMDGSGLTFFVRTEQEDEVKVRKLALSIEENELRSCMFSWLKTVEAIEFDGKCPTASLKYVDSTLPVTVEAIAMSPLIPHNEIASATPGFYMTFKVKNNTSSPITASLLGKLQNPICKDDMNRMLKNNVIHDGSTTRISLSTDSTNQLSPYNGSMCFSVDGGDISWISGEYRQYIDSYISSTSEFGVSEESILFPFRKNGTLPNINVENSLGNEVWLPDSQLAKLEDEEIEGLVKEYKKYAFAQSLAERITQVNEDFFNTRDGQISFIKLIRDCANKFEGQNHGDSKWGDCALNSSFTLEPNEEKEVRFTVSWFFPNHYSLNGYRLGHMYENQFDNALEVNTYLDENYTKFGKVINNFITSMTNTNLSSQVADSWLIHLTTLIKSSWWIKDGRFGIWEGIGSCGFHTTDITYQGSFNLIALYPEIQKRQMLMGAEFQNDQGRVHHFFTPDLSSVDDGFARVDMNSQFVLLVCRDYLWTGDKEYLTDIYPNVKAAIASLALLDTDKDGLLDVETRHNTYDAWNFFGAPSYIESLWLSCLKAGAFLAKEMGDVELAQGYEDLLATGKKSMEEMLWNGKYFDLWVDGDKRDGCCMTDQLSGEWFIRLMGMGGILSDEKVKTASKNIIKHNFSGENGLINASYPEGVKPTIYTHRNCQAEANWTGIEYAFSSFLYLLGEDDIATKIVETVDERHKRSARIWDHTECGDHYYRAMSSWSTLLAATGFSINVPENEISICPNTKQEKLYGPWVAAGCFGNFTKEENSLTVDCVSGELTVQKIVSDFSEKSFEVRINDQEIKHSTICKDGHDCVIFDQVITLKAGDQLSIRSTK